MVRILLFCVATLVAMNLHESFAAEIPTPVQATSQSGNWQISFDSDTRYYSWSGTRGFPTTGFNTLPVSADSKARGSGQQTYSPFGLQITGKLSDDWKIELAARSGYVSSRQTTPGIIGSIDTWLDTSLSGTLTYYGWKGIAPFASLNFNLPTGTTVLGVNSFFARMDPDLVGVASFGEGFNFGPTLGANIALSDSLILNLSAGYTNRGTFDQIGVTDLVGHPQAGISRLNPGDNVTVQGTLGYAINKLTLQLTGMYMTDTTTASDGNPLYKAGDRRFVIGSAAYQWTDWWTSSLRGTWTYASKNLLRNGVAGTPLTLEAFNSNSNVYQVTYENRFKAGIVSFGPTVGYLYRDHDQYDPIINLFVPQKTRWAAGGLLDLNLTNQFTVFTRLERVWTSENANPGPGGPLKVPPVENRGWMGSIGGTARF
jgi:hypothetical protein